MIQENVVEPIQPVSFRRISWGAVFAGVTLAMVAQVVMSMLGLGIGLSTVEPLTEQQPAAGIGVGAGIWWTASALISLFVGGWVAGRLAGVPRTFESVVHGILTWGVSTLLMLFLITTTVGNIIGGALGIAGRGLSLAGQGFSRAAPQIVEQAQEQLQQSGIDINSIKQEAQRMLRQAPQQASDPQVQQVLDRYFRPGGPEPTEADRQAAIDTLVSRLNLSRQEATQMVTRWEQLRRNFQQSQQQLEQKARQTADTAARAVSQASLWGFVALLLGAAASAIGGYVGTPEETIAIRP